MVKDSVEDIEVIYVDAMVATSEGTLLYEGILVDYELSSDGGLNQIYLKEVVRRYLSHDEDDSAVEDDSADGDDRYEPINNRHYPINGHILSLKYSEIKNLNFTYLTIDKKNDKFSVRLVR